MDSLGLRQARQPYAELSAVLLRVYPELRGLPHSPVRRLAVAVYQLNRTAQLVLETFNRNKPVQGLSRGTLPHVWAYRKQLASNRGVL